MFLRSYYSTRRKKRIIKVCFCLNAFVHCYQSTMMSTVKLYEDSEDDGANSLYYMPITVLSAKCRWTHLSHKNYEVERRNISPNSCKYLLLASSLNCSSSRETSLNYLSIPSQTNQLKGKMERWAKEKYLQNLLFTGSKNNVKGLEHKPGHSQVSGSKPGPTGPLNTINLVLMVPSSSGWRYRPSALGIESSDPHSWAKCCLEWPERSFWRLLRSWKNEWQENCICMWMAMFSVNKWTLALQASFHSCPGVIDQNVTGWFRFKTLWCPFSWVPLMTKLLEVSPNKMQFMFSILMTSKIKVIIVNKVLQS